MRLNTLLPLLGFLFAAACHTAQPAVQPAPSGVPAAFVTWDKKLVELGAVKKGETRDMFYEFTNTSAEDAQIDIVDACECTTVDYPRGIISPGQKGRLNVRFDSAQKDSSETININVIFKNTHANGVPRIEVLSYAFELIK